MDAIVDSKTAHTDCFEQRVIEVQQEFSLE